MPGSENFNSGATLASLGWTNITNAENTAAAGPDGSYALATVDQVPPPNSSSADMPVSPCTVSEHVRITFDWDRALTYAGSGNTRWMLHCTGANPTDWGGTSDDWLVKLAHYGTLGDEQAGHVFTNGDGGMNVWNIPGLFPTVAGGNKKFRIDIKFSSGFDEPGHDGTRLFGAFPGTPQAPNTDATRAPTADGEIRVYWGADVASLALVYEVTGIGIANPRLRGQTSVAYNRFHFAPEGAIDNIEWEDFCSESGVPVNESTPCCGSNVDSPGGETNPGELLPPNPFVSLPVPTVTCTGLGTVLTAGNPSEPESWAL